MSVMEFINKTVLDLKVGQTMTFSKTVSETDVMMYAGFAGDFSPLYLNNEYAKTTIFGKRLAHPMLVVSLSGRCVSMLCTPGGVNKSRSFDFIAPVFIGDTVTAVAQVGKIDAGSKLVYLNIECFNQHKELVMQGQAVEEMSAAKDGGEDK